MDNAAAGEGSRSGGQEVCERKCASGSMRAEDDGPVVEKHGLTT